MEERACESVVREGGASGGEEGVRADAFPGIQVKATRSVTGNCHKMRLCVMFFFNSPLPALRVTLLGVPMRAAQGEEGERVLPRWQARGDV